MVALRGDLYAVSPNQGEVDRISTHTGAISRLVDLSAIVGSIVPTAITSFRGDLYLGNLGGFPVVPGSEVILKVTPGEIRVTVPN
jgi:hypothetical protein